MNKDMEVIDKIMKILNEVPDSDMTEDLWEIFDVVDKIADTYDWSE